MSQIQSKNISRQSSLQLGKYSFLESQHKERPVLPAGAKQIPNVKKNIEFVKASWFSSKFNIKRGIFLPPGVCVSGVCVWWVVAWWVGVWSSSNIVFNRFRTSRGWWGRRGRFVGFLVYFWNAIFRIVDPFWDPFRISLHACLLSFVWTYFSLFPFLAF